MENKEKYIVKQNKEIIYASVDVACIGIPELDKLEDDIKVLYAKYINKDRNNLLDIIVKCRDEFIIKIISGYFNKQEEEKKFKEEILK